MAAAVVAVLTAAVPTAAVAAPPAPRVAGAHGPVAPSSRVDTPDGPTRARRLVVAGGATLAGGLVVAGVGFGLLAGLHLGNPGGGTALAADDPARARKLLAAARTAEVLGTAGLVTAGVGAVLLGVGRARLRRAGRLALLPAGAGIALAGRF